MSCPAVLPLVTAWFLSGVLAALGWRQSEEFQESCCEMPLVVVATGGGDQLDGQPRGQKQITGMVETGLFKP